MTQHDHPAAVPGCVRCEDGAREGRVDMEALYYNHQPCDIPKHRRADGTTHCAGAEDGECADGDTWPCTIAQLVGEFRTLTAQLQAAGDSVAKAREFYDLANRWGDLVIRDIASGSISTEQKEAAFLLDQADAAFLATLPPDADAAKALGRAE